MRDRGNINWLRKLRRRPANAPSASEIRAKISCLEELAKAQYELLWGKGYEEEKISFSNLAENSYALWHSGILWLPDKVRGMVSGVFFYKGEEQKHLEYECPETSDKRSIKLAVPNGACRRLALPHGYYLMKTK